MAFHARLFRVSVGDLPQVRLVAILALHVHAEVHFVLADCLYVRVALEARFGGRPYLALDVRLVALIAVDLHGRLVAIFYLDRLFDDRRFRHKVLDVHRSVRDQLLPDLVVGAVAEEALFPAGQQVLGPVRMAIKTRKRAHAFTVDLSVRVAFETEFFRRQKAVQALMFFIHRTVALRAR